MMKAVSFAISLEVMAEGLKSMVDGKHPAPYSFLWLPYSIMGSSQIWVPYWRSL